MVLSEIVKNFLIKFPFIKRVAKTRHYTGVNQSAEGIRLIYDFYRQYTDFNQKDVIELGPGQTYGVIKKIREAGAESVTIIDIEKYIPDDVLKENQNLQYIIYNGGEMPVSSNSFDIILSYTVYEHLRKPDVTINETFRILRMGGIAIHLIDLCDHLQYGPRGNPDKIFNCLKYKTWLWNLMSYNRSVYVNRYRQCDWIRAHKNAGFEIVHAEGIVNGHIKTLFRNGQLQYLGRYKPEDRFVGTLKLIVRKT